MTSLDLKQVDSVLNPTGTFRVELTDEQIPFHLLGPDNPILHGGQIYLHEADLEDTGYTMG